MESKIKIVKEIEGIDIHFLTVDNQKQTVSYSDFKNGHGKLSVERKIDHLGIGAVFTGLNKIRLDAECSGYCVNIGRKVADMFKIVDVNVIVPDKVVEVTFADGTKEKSVCREPDVFSLESAISICISKKIMGGSSAYNNVIKRGMKVYEDKLKKEAEEKAEQERIEKKRAKRLAYKERRAVKRAEEENKKKAREREEQIAIQTEAYLRAMDIIRDENKGA